MEKQLIAIVEREGDGYVSLCAELDIASQGETIEEARDNLREALDLFFESASPEEIKQCFHEEVYVTLSEDFTPRRLARLLSAAQPALRGHLSGISPFLGRHNDPIFCPF